MHKVFGEKKDVEYIDRRGAYLVPVRDRCVGVVQTDKGYFLLGGGLKEGESDEICIRRECIEEVGYRASIKYKIGLAETYCKIPTIGFFHPIQSYYIGELFEKIKEPTEKDHRLIWIEFENLKGKMYLEMQDWALEEAWNAINNEKCFQYFRELSSYDNAAIIMHCEGISDRNRDMINDFIRQQWHTTTMVIRGKEIDMTKAEGFYIRDGLDIIGLVTFIVYNRILEILSLDSRRENHGIGSRLVERVVYEAKERGCQKVVLITTNDNINAIRFYQKRGFDMTHLFCNAIDAARKLKPEIPLIGENSIPMRHEIEFEMII